MREVLKALAGRRFRVFGIVSRFGKKKAFKGPDLDTVCVEWVRDKVGNLLTDHVWIQVGSQIKSLCLKPGDKVSFSARSTPYMKGYKGRRSDSYKSPELDYRLSHCTKFLKISADDSGKIGGLFEGV